MRKRLVVLGSCLAVSIAGGAAASDIEFGAYGGMIRSYVPVLSSSESRSFAVGGGFVAIPLTDRASLVVGPELLTRGYNYLGRGFETETARYLEVPALFRFASNRTDRLASPYVLVGPSVGLRLTHTIEERTYSGVTLAPVNISGAAAAGVRVGHRLAFFAEIRGDVTLVALGDGSNEFAGLQFLVGLSLRAGNQAPRGAGH